MVVKDLIVDHSLELSVVIIRGRELDTVLDVVHFHTVILDCIVVTADTAFFIKASECE
jgi:hypothetical protein